MIINIVFVLGVAFAIWTLVDLHMRSKRRVFFNNLKCLYDKMEMIAFTERLTPTNNLIDYLKLHKNLIVNEELADIRVLLAIRMLTPPDRLQSNRDQFYRLRERMPKEMLDLEKDFNHQYHKLILLSRWSFGFLYFLVKLLCKSAVGTLVHKGKNSIHGLSNAFSDVLNENLIIPNLRYKGYQYA